MNNKINIIFPDNKVKEYDEGITYYEISKDYQTVNNKKIIGVKIKNEIMPMQYKAKNNDQVNFFDVTDLNGYKMNQSGLKFVLEVALKETFGKDYEVTYDHSIARGLHMTILSPKAFGKEDTLVLKKAMEDLILADERITSLNVEKREALKYYEKTNNHEKAMDIHNVMNSIANVYKLKNYINYFYTEMPYSTGSLNSFDLVCLEEQKLVLLFPDKDSANTVPPYISYDPVIKCFKEGKEWLKSLNIPYLSDLNNEIANSTINDIIRATEINFDNHIHDIVDDIIIKKSKYIMLAGPSSSGKTTTTKKIALALKARGYDPLVLSVDNYFKDRKDSPKDEFGNYDFECLEAIELDLLNNHLKKLVLGEEVDMPEYNFVLGEKEYHQRPTKISDKGIILLEGLHCLNDDMTRDIDSSLKYRIYLSPFIPLNIDKHNYVSTVDLRLLRRMVRDNRTRGADVSKTIAYWQTVRHGEEKYIFPYIHNADKVLNTSLVYEIGVMKVYAEPLLYSVSIDSPYYEEARRLLNFLRGFFPISSDYIGKDSILREFIGGSSFE